jgi:hypothetical protein
MKWDAQTDELKVVATADTHHEAVRIELDVCKAYFDPKDEKDNLVKIHAVLKENATHIIKSTYTHIEAGYFSSGSDILDKEECVAKFFIVHVPTDSAPPSSLPSTITTHRRKTAISPSYAAVIKELKLKLPKPKM